MFNKDQVFEITIPDIDDVELNTKIINRYLTGDNAIDILNRLKKNSKDGAIVMTPDDNEYTKWKKNVIVVLSNDDIGIVPKSWDEFWEFVKKCEYENSTMEEEKIDVDPYLDEKLGAYDISYDENGKPSFKKNKMKTSLMGILDEINEAVGKAYEKRESFSDDEFDKAVSEFRKMSDRSQSICVYDNIFRGILLVVNAYGDILKAIATGEPIVAEEFTTLLNMLHEIESFFSKEV